MKVLKRVLVAVCLSAGLFLLSRSYIAYGKWYHEFKIGDLSGAEIYEVEFWFLTPPALLLIFVGVFFAGRFSVRRPPD